jgi:putative flippase GtrA
MLSLPTRHAEKLRFGTVGIANTALDFAILFLLVNFGLDKIASNYISTSISFIFSFFVNRSFTFKSKSDDKKRQFFMFFIVTVFGLWVIQPIVITATVWLISSQGITDSVVLLIAKLLATIASLIWNYVLYSRLVFKKEL